MTSYLKLLCVDMCYHARNGKGWGIPKEKIQLLAIEIIRVKVGDFWQGWNNIECRPLW